MSDKKKKKLTPAQQQYQNFAKENETKRKVFTNCLKAFLVGGTICAVGQGLQFMFIKYFNFTETTAGNPTSAILIIISVLLTGFGVFDHIAQWAGAGTAIPVTGFANSIASCAIEHKSEGFVLGVGGNMFKLAGSVISFGVFSAFVMAIVRIIIQWLGGM
ncbi:stage V sporulation protein AC [Clostridium sp. MT-14]|jgi:stage V sporulation protein AC|uniref:Stage V sporulation protein AC n=1 Tax=Clostridium aromativorans TaxID=2836848 RepID=A0ABS8N9V1_9CLOT|nr:MULTISPECIES: stage V sporulation protein AC [Clostridium]KAA8668047.1 stage V sporulation protein AC [Clostridium sp. HV4-5-A1G]MCC9295488.1 stage V sporulation protein AC [Clostridium aromativorans]CAB1245274.1 mechanosensitive channel; stage V sporulation protein AC [Clostridiaceae bacterium BL-3]